MSESPKKLGRPPLKKGKSSWKPASLNEFFDKEDGYRYRMSRKDEKNLANKEAEGWETVSAIKGGKTKHIDPGRIDDGKPLSSVVEGRDWVLQRMDEEMAQARDAYINNETARRTSGLTAHLKKEMGTKAGNAPVHGNITISSRMGVEEIE